MPDPQTIDHLRIESLKKDESTAEVEGHMYVQVNPETYSLSHTISLDENQASGTSNRQQKQNKTYPDKLSMDLIFDRSGIVPLVKQEGGRMVEELTEPDMMKGVNEDIDRFKSLIFEHKGDIHRPNTVRLLWGDMVFKGRLTNLSIEYTLFRPSGIPSRAKLSVEFEGTQEIKEMLAKQRDNSPDLTHIRTVAASDKLPLMAYRIYNDPCIFFRLQRRMVSLIFESYAWDNSFGFPLSKNRYGWKRSVTY